MKWIRLYIPLHDKQPSREMPRATSIRLIGLLVLKLLGLTSDPQLQRALCFGFSLNVASTEKIIEKLLPHPGKSRASFYLCVAALLQLINSPNFAVVAPEFWNPQVCVKLELIQVSMGDINFQDQIWGRIIGQIYGLTPHQRFILNVVALFRFATGL